MQEQPDAAADDLPVPAAATGDERGADDQDEEAEARGPVRDLRVGRAVGAAHRRGGGGDRGREPETGRGDEAGQGGAAGGGEEEGREVREDQDDREGAEEALPRRHHRRRALPRQVPRQGRPRRRDRRHRRPRRRLLPQPRRPGGPDQASAPLIDGGRSFNSSRRRWCVYVHTTVLGSLICSPNRGLHLARNWPFQPERFGFLSCQLPRRSGVHHPQIVFWFKASKFNLFWLVF
uniref:Uncharacterized protein n=1 Tax=Oryza rufipogon TaxID=4529 RepID=A0A0E0NRA4_ORYRU